MFTKSKSPQPLHTYKEDRIERLQICSSMYIHTLPFAQPYTTTHLYWLKVSDECVSEHGFELAPAHISYFRLHLLPTATSANITAMSAYITAMSACLSNKIRKLRSIPDHNNRTRFGLFITIQVSRGPCQVSTLSSCHLTSLLLPVRIW